MTEWLLHSVRFLDILYWSVVVCILTILAVYTWRKNL
jgi:hypothetical protein